MLIFYSLFYIPIILLLISIVLPEFKSILLFTCVVFLVLMCGLRGQIDQDNLNYQRAFSFMNYYSDMFTPKMMEPMTVIIVVFCKNIFENNYNHQIIFFIYALFAIILKMLFFSKYSDNKYIWLSVLIYISSYFLVQEMTQIRAGLSAAILLFSLSDLYNKSYFKFLTKVLLASLFHYSSLIYLLLVFVNIENVNKSKIFWLILSFFIFAILGVNQFVIGNLSFGYGNKITAYVDLSNIVKSPAYRIYFSCFNIKTLFIVYVLFNLIKYQKNLVMHNKQTVLFIKVLFLGLLIQIGLSGFDEMSLRFSDFFYLVAGVCFTWLFRVKKSHSELYLVFSIFCVYSILEKAILIKSFNLSLGYFG